MKAKKDYLGHTFKIINGTGIGQRGIVTGHSENTTTIKPISKWWVIRKIQTIYYRLTLNHES